jgi:hypothetical protein
MGNYLQITNIDFPAEAEEGTTVNVVVEITNVSDINISYVHATLLDNIPQQTGGDQVLYSGSKGYWVFSFVMPACDVDFWILARFWSTDGAWHTDDSQQETVVLTDGEEPPEPPEDIAGDIESIRVKSEGKAWALAPQTVEAGKAISIKFNAHSKYGSFPYGLYFDASVRLRKPSGSTEERYDAQTTGPYDYCSLSAFIFGEGGLSAGWGADEQGDYHATIILRARTSLTGSSEEIARTSEFKAFTVTEPIQPPDEYSGHINPVRVRTDYFHSQWEAAPKTITQGTPFSINFTVSNTSAIALVLRGAFDLKWPGGRVETGSDKTGTDLIEDSVAPGARHNFSWNTVGHVNPFTADEAGDYTVKFRLHGKKWGEPDSAFKEICDPWEGKVLEVTEAEDPSDPGDPGAPTPGVYPGNIRNLIIRWENLSGRDIPIPVVGEAPVGESAKIAYTCYNESDRNLHITSEMWIKSPSDPKKYHYGPHTPWRVGGYSPGAGPDFIWPGGDPLAAFLIDEEGEWDLHITQTTEVDGVEYLMAEYDGPLFTAEVAPPGMWGMMGDIMPLMMIMMMFMMMVPMMKEFGEEEKPKVRVVTEPKQLPEGRG